MPRVVLSGVALGAVWGSLMWAAFELIGRGSGPRGLVYLAFTIAMIGGGVAAVLRRHRRPARRGEGLPPRARGRPPRPQALTCPGALAPALPVDYPRRVTVLGGELAVPCTRNPLQRG